MPLTPYRFDPFPVLITERLVLRQLRDTDDKEIFFLRSHDGVNEFLVAATKAKSIDEARAFIRTTNAGILAGAWIYWVITLKGSERLIGTICLWHLDPMNQKAEIGYVLNPALQRNGYMYEAVKEVIRYGLNDMNLAIIEAISHRDNARSLSLLKKAGFQYHSSAGDEETYRLVNTSPLLVFPD
jgi:ribosomal-protein-alanine N-acetyltransferase